MFGVESMKGINLNFLEISVVYRFAYKPSTRFGKASVSKPHCSTNWISTCLKVIYHWITLSGFNLMFSPILYKDGTFERLMIIMRCVYFKDPQSIAVLSCSG